MSKIAKAADVSPATIRRTTMKGEEWNAEKIPDQTGTVVAVTGSSSGIGYETARVLANKNAEVIIAVRNLDKGDAAAQKIRSQYPKANVRVMRTRFGRSRVGQEFRGRIQEQILEARSADKQRRCHDTARAKTADGFE